MLSFITFKDAPEQVEIVADKEGLLELIQYLQGIEKQKDHMHLTIGNELNSFPIAGDRVGKSTYAKHVRLEYSDTNTWETRPKE